MQQNCVSNLAYLPGLDFTSFFLPQNDPHMYDFDSLDMVSPYNCNGSTTTVSSMSAGTADNQARCSNDERKKRRLASNRESARRSRVRKQRRLEELSSQVAELLDTNQRLLIELNHMIVKHTCTVRENAELREEASDLKKRLNEMKVEEAEAAPGTPEVA
ncbi:basic leucine zipper 8-like [Phragmites australis]|uniref:basic leucine zipper 8-like n=1 Tax=Phragmites australis TaxID=29695 RepID=UPI002D78249C|nr:basic leucine zipper 8-like [Phragmites australis]